MSRVFPGLLGTFGHGTLVVGHPRCLVYRIIPGCPEYSQDFLGLLDWDFGSHNLVGHPGMSRDVLSCPRTSWDFWTWDFGSHDLVGHPGMSRVFPGLLGTFGPGTLVEHPGMSEYPRIWTYRTSRDVPSCPRTSWDFWTGDFGSHVW